MFPSSPLLVIHLLIHISLELGSLQMIRVDPKSMTVVFNVFDKKDGRVKI